MEYAHCEDGVMARLRAVEVAEDEGSQVPAELTDFDAPAWRDPTAFRQWLAGHVTQQPPARQLEMMCESSDYGARYRFAVDVWAVENGFGQERWPKMPNRDRLEQAGIPRMKALERARRRLIMEDQ